MEMSEIQRLLFLWSIWWGNSQAHSVILRKTNSHRLCCARCTRQLWCSKTAVGKRQPRETDPLRHDTEWSPGKDGGLLGETGTAPGTWGTRTGDKWGQKHKICMLRQSIDLGHLSSVVERGCGLGLPFLAALSRRHWVKPGGSWAPHCHPRQVACRLSSPCVICNAVG